MNKIYIKYKLLVFFIFFLINSIQGQEIKSNEIKLNLVFALFDAVEINYERQIYKKSGVGILLNYNIGDSYLINKYAISPYYRRYFGKERSTGFFLEISVDYFKDDDAYEYSSIKKIEPPIGLGPRLSAGCKFFRGDYWFCEIIAGGGYSLINQELLINPEFGRFGIFVGRRF